jgi:hypothetical protein
MESNAYYQWFAEQPVPYLSLDSYIADTSSSSHYPELPPIPEQQEFNFDFDWGGDTFAPAYPPFPSEPTQLAVPAAVEEETQTTAAVPPQVLQELSSLLQEVQALRQAVLEFAEAVNKRLDSMEKSVTVAQRYVNNLIPWSMEVHQNYAKIMEVVAERQLEIQGDRQTID